MNDNLNSSAFPLGTFTVDLENVLKARGMPNYIRATALILRNRDYETVGNIFQMLSDEEITRMGETAEIVMGGADDISPDEYAMKNAEEFQNALLFSFLLLRAEGEIVEGNNDDLNKYLSAAMTFGVIESLHRKGAVFAMHENFSLLDVNRQVVKPNPNWDGQL